VFSRVTDPNVRSAGVLPIQRLIDYRQTKLPKFVQINWCGDGVPEAKKGLFHTHSTAVSRFFRGTHVVISARNEVRQLHVFASRPSVLRLREKVRCHAISYYVAG